MTLPKRDARELIEALRIRALALTGEAWERTATRDMMNEAAQMLEDLTTVAIYILFQDGLNDQDDLRFGPFDVVEMENENIIGIRGTQRTELGWFSYQFDHWVTNDDVRFRLARITTDEC